MICLPNKYRAAHQYAFFLHDMLLTYFVIGENQGWFTTRFQFRSKAEIEAFERLTSEDIIDWFEQNGYIREAMDIQYRMVIAGLIADFSHFVFEGLKCAEKGKLSVAYTLFRKPFKDNLLLLEWLLAEPHDFLLKFRKDAVNFAPGRLESKRKLDIIGKARNKLPSVDVFDAQLLYDLRYNKEAEYGMEGIWNCAAHIVTDKNGWKTESGNLNFVFSEEDDMLDQWDALYKRLPLLLFYATEIVEALITTMVVLPAHIATVNLLKRKICFFMWGLKFRSKTIPGIIRPGLGFLDTIPCKYCAATIILNIPNLYGFLYNNSMICSKCLKHNKFNRELSLKVHKAKVLSLATWQD